MKVGIVVFPGSNCDHDAWYVLSESLHHEAVFIWHESESVGDVNGVILPGGFAFGDYLRCGAIAKFSPVMRAVKNFARNGGLVLGICNGFQVLTESGLLPGALVRNSNLTFVCRTVRLEVIAIDSPFTHQASSRQLLKLPVAHGEGCYVADESTLDQLEAEDRVVLRYLDNPNGSMRDIAGIVNAERNVMGMMPHPERASDVLLGGTDGIVILGSMLAANAAKTSVFALSR
jgi:phosphoribosylformylglycinamidine synthase I